jgi:hypothetical protein
VGPHQWAGGVSLAALLARCPPGAFPYLAGDAFEKTSEDDLYNCIAWAADDTVNWWWPDASSSRANGYWPDGVPEHETMPAFVAAYGTRGYKPCPDGRFEFAWERVVTYCDQSGTPTHAARQRDDGAWTSKLGALWDIRHATPRGVEGPFYGTALQYLRRPLACRRWIPRLRCRSGLFFGRLL